MQSVSNLFMSGYECCDNRIEKEKKKKKKRKTDESRMMSVARLGSGCNTGHSVPSAALLKVRVVKWIHTLKRQVAGFTSSCSRRSLREAPP